MVGSMVLHVMAYGRASVIRLTDVYYSPLITRNIVLYGKLELKRYGLKYKDNRRALISLTTGNCVFDVAMCNNVLFLEMQNTKVNEEMEGTVMAAIDEATKKKDEEDVHVTSTGDVCHVRASEADEERAVQEGHRGALTN
ncbi:unnamed protein product [Peronospora effusa]|nr:unnamed protein product [Peronospora effusa]